MSALKSHPPLVARSSSVHACEVFHFRFEHMGWATFSVCEATGELSIQSDWGAASFRWNTETLGCPSLKEFFARTEAGYVFDKLSYGNRAEFDDVVDMKATEQALHERIAQHRREGSIEKEEARDLWDSAKDFADQVGESLDAAYANADGDLLTFLGGDLYEYIRRRPTARTEFWLERLLPFFLKHMRQHFGPRRVDGVPSDGAP